MKISDLLHRRFHWINLPGAILMVLLQRMPTLNVVCAGEEMVAASPVGTVLKAAVAAVAALGAVNTMAGATPLVPSSGSASGITVAAGSSVSVFYTVNGTQTPPVSWSVTGSVPPGLNFSGLTGSGGSVNVANLNLSGTPTAAGSYNVTLQAFQFANEGGISSPSYSYTITVTGSVNVAPSITQDPQSQTVLAGSSVTFTAAASGTPAPSFQWQKDGADIGGATGSSFTIGSVSPGDAGSYTVIATNAAGSATSNAATLTVNIPTTAPSITQNPQSQTVTAGNSVTFSAAASGTPAPSLQWRKNNVNIPGANGSSLSLNNVQLSDAGSYTLVATNAAGAVASNAATLTVNVAPAFTTQPGGATVFLGGSAASFSVAATGSPAPTYQWQRLPAGSGTWGNLANGGVYSGVTTATLAITGATLAMSGDQFRCVATNTVGSVTSNAATLTVVVPLPVINTQPLSQAVLVGSAVGLSVTASSPVSVTYQWQKNNVNIPGATSSSYNIASFGSGDVGSYDVVVTNSAGSVTSNTATLAIAQPPVITTDPASQTVIAGAPASFAVTVTSNAALSYVWRKNDVTIPGATNATYAIASAQASDAANYSVVVTNIAGSATSGEATLTVQLPPTITQQPVNQSVLTGGTATFTVAATSTTTLSYQWQRLPAGSGTWANVTNNATYAGSSTATLTASNLVLGSSGDQFRCVVTNVAGAVTSNAATLGVASAGFAKISAGRYHSLRLNISSQLYAAGLNTSGQLGDGTTTSNASPELITLPGQTIANLAAGAQHSLLLTNAKDLWVSGYNGNGQLGDGTLVAKSTPFKLTANIAGMAGAVFHSAYLKSDGTLWTFGGNDSGQLGNGTTTDSATPVQVATGVIDVALGNHQSFFLKSDGTLWGVGDMNNTTAPVSTPVQVASNVTSFTVGAFHSLFLKSDGTLWGLGFNASGQLGNGTTTTALTPVQIATGVQAAAAGYFFSVFLKTDGTLWAMGTNGSGQLGDGTTTTRLSPVQLATNVAAVSASEAYTLFTKLDGTLWATGYNANGQFGNGGTTTVSTPVQIATGTVLTPATPAGLGAGTVATQDRVHLLWTPAADARTYEVWRNTVNDSSTATRLAQNVRWAIYEDLTAQSGQGYYYWVRAVNPTGSSAFSAPVVGATTNAVAPGITTQPQSQTVNVGATVTFSVTASGTAPFTYQWRKNSGNLTDGGSLSGSATATLMLTGAALTDAGSYDVVVTNSAGSITSTAATLTVNQLTQSITFGPLADTSYTPTPFGLSATASSGLAVSFSVVSGPANISGNNVTLTGVGTVTVRAAQAGNATYAPAANVDQSFNVTKAAASVTLGSLGATFDGSAHGATATTNPNGLAVSFTYNGSATVPTNAGSYAVVGTISDALYQGSASGTLTIGKAVASVTLGSLTPTYDGTAKSATATTNPASLTVSFTYNGSTTAPTNPGTYAVVGTISDANYQGSASGTLTIGKAVASVTLGSLTPTYDGTAKSATATTNPASLTVSFTYNGSTTAPTNPGTYAVVGTISDANYQGSASGTLTIGKAVASVTLGSLTPTYDGTAKSATATTNPASLTVSFTYNGSVTAPTNAGSYAVVGTISDANYQGVASGTLTIAKADQTIAFTGPSNQPYSATPITLSATASSGLVVTFSVPSGPATVSGNTLTLTGAGAVTVRASQAGDANRNAAPDVDQSFTVTGNFASWAQSKFTAAELLDPNISGPNAVYGQDGLPNLVKYALGLEPKQNSTTGLPYMSTLATDWVYIYTRPSGVTDVTYDVEVSTDLVNWTTTGVTHELVSTDGTTDTWRGRYPLASAANVFFRLKVTQ